MNLSSVEIRLLEEKCEALSVEVELWKERCGVLDREVEFLRAHPTISQGLKGERIVCSVTQGMMTKYAERYDVKLRNEITLEVKYSKLNTPVSTSPTRRWNWGRPLGSGNGKVYDFLVLLGEKDWRFQDQWVDESPYMTFLIPFASVPLLMSEGKREGMISLSTNFLAGWSKKSKIVRNYVIDMNELEDLIFMKIK
jgi:hypothetical protein